MSCPGSAFLGSARVSRSGFGVAPKQAFPRHRCVPRCEIPIQVRDGEDAIANTRDACAPQT
jgi:hypothetical protein